MTEAPQEEGVCLSEQKIPYLYPPPLCPHRSPQKLGIVHTPLWAHVNVCLEGTFPLHLRSDLTDPNIFNPYQTATSLSSLPTTMSWPRALGKRSQPTFGWGTGSCHRGREGPEPSRPPLLEIYSHPVPPV